MDYQTKSPMRRYTIRDLRSDFPDDESCLEWLKEYRWPNGVHCETCDKVTPHHRMTTRRSYSCQECGNHVHPTAGTIFHKSTTPLTLWFHAIYLMASTRQGIAAKQVEREIGVTYKTAWRMCRLIRQQLEENLSPFAGPVEVDETYMGGKAKNMHDSDRRRKITARGTKDKTPVVGIVERGGKIKTFVVPNVQRQTIEPLIGEHVAEGATVYTDEHSVYDRLPGFGYDHARVVHSHRVYVDGRAHTQTIEGFWGNAKSGIIGVYRHVSDKFLPEYMGEYGFRYNHRQDETPMFKSFLYRVGLLSDHLAEAS